MFVVEGLQREKEHGLQITHIKNPAVKLMVYYTLIFSVVLFGATKANQFIYFKF